MNNTPKAVRIAEHKMNTALWTFLVQKRLDLKTVSETNVFQRRSHDQCVMANVEKPRKPKKEAFIIRAVPIVAHHKRKYGFALVARIPETIEPCLECEGLMLSSFCVLSVRTPMYINIRPPGNAYYFLGHT